MKKITFVICAILMVLMVSPVQAAAHQPTGDQINIYEFRGARISGQHRFLYSPWI